MRFGVLQGMLWLDMEPVARPSFEPAAAGGVLLGTTLACAALGTLIGWASGSWAYGLLAGALVGVPLGILAVYRRFRRFFT